jgi:hypothetical protein
MGLWERSGLSASLRLCFNILRREVSNALRFQDVRIKLLLRYLFLPAANHHGCESVSDQVGERTAFAHEPVLPSRLDLAFPLPVAFTRQLWLNSNKGT